MQETDRMTILRTSDALTRASYPYQEQSSDQYIRGSNTQPEMLVRRFLFARSFRYCLHVKDLPRKPDIVLPKSLNKPFPEDNGMV